MGYNKDISKFLKELEKRGWRIVQGRVHYKCWPPNGGQMMVVSVSASCQHAIKKIKCMAEKIENGTYHYGDQTGK